MERHSQFSAISGPLKIGGRGVIICGATVTFRRIPAIRPKPVKLARAKLFFLESTNCPHHVFSPSGTTKTEPSVKAGVKRSRYQRTRLPVLPQCQWMLRKQSGNMRLAKCVPAPRAAWTVKVTIVPGRPNRQTVAQLTLAKCQQGGADGSEKFSSLSLNLCWIG